MTWVRVHYREHRLTVTITSPPSGNPEYYQDLYVDVRRTDSRVDYDDTRHRVHYSVPVTCPMCHGADQPRRIRLSLVTRTEDERATDRVPAKHRLSRWVLWK